MPSSSANVAGAAAVTDGRTRDPFGDRAALAATVEANAPEWGLAAPARATLLEISENETFLVEAADGERVVVRAYRPGGNTDAEIAAEHDWIGALRAAGAVRTPALRATARGATLLHVPTLRALLRLAAFEHCPGSEPSRTGGDETAIFEQVGAVCAALHDHAIGWKRPDNFTRKRWTFDTMIAPTPFWGDWRAAPGLDGAMEAVIGRATQRLRDRLARYGTGRDRFGLIHGDLRAANLIQSGDALHVIDFDDCGFGWHAYDFAAAISFREAEPGIEALKAAWLRGYRSVRAFPEEDAAIIPDMVMLRRVLLTAWIGSHPEASAARALAPTFARGTAMLAARYLGEA